MRVASTAMASRFTHADLALKERGASPLKAVASAGGGARNPQWAALRSNLLGVDVVRAANSDAAFGAAVLALRG